MSKSRAYAIDLDVEFEPVRKKSQVDKFKEAARELECDDSESKFQRKMRSAKLKSDTKDEGKKPSKPSKSGRGR